MTWRGMRLLLTCEFRWQCSITSLHFPPGLGTTKARRKMSLLYALDILMMSCRFCS